MDVSTAALLATPESEVPCGLQSALVVLSRLAGDETDVGRFVDPDRGQDGYLDWSAARTASATWSNAEKTLLDVAMALWGRNRIDLWEMFRDLDGPSTRRVILALEVHFGFRDFHDALREAWMGWH
jgi:hypothetical protein